MDFGLYTVEKASYDSLHLEMIKPYWTVSFVREGQVEACSQGFVNHATDGDIMIHPPHVPFTETAEGKGVHLWMLIDLRIVPRFHFFQRFPISRVVRLKDASAYAVIFERLLRVWEAEPSPVRDFQAVALGLQLLAYILESWNAAGSPSRQGDDLTEEDRFLKVIAFMEENMGDKIRREDLAELLHLHPSYFNRIFKRVYGMSSVQMLKAMRLKRSMQLLEDPANTLEGIATVCGFADAPYFSKVFKLSTGMTPGEYRDSIKTTKEGYAAYAGPGRR